MYRWVILAVVPGLIEAGCAGEQAALRAKVQVLDGWAAEVECVRQNPGGPKGAPVEGQLRLVSLTLKNISDGPIVLVKVRTDRSVERGYSWQQSRYGGLGWDKEGKAFLHHSMVQQATPAVFNDGLLWPEQEATAELAVRLTGSRKTFLVTYYALSREELSVWFYPPAPPAQQTTEFETERYPKMTPEQLSEAMPCHGLFLATTGQYDPRFAGSAGSEPSMAPVWKPPEKPPEPQKFASTETFSLRPREGILAKGKAPDAQTIVGFCDALDGWIVQAQDGRLRFTDGRKNFRLPQMDPLAWDLIDAEPGPYQVQVDKKQPAHAGAATPKKRPTPNADYGDLFPPYAGDGMYTYGVFVDVPRAKLADFLKRAYRKGHTVGVQFYFFDSWHLTSLPDKSSH